MTTRHRLLFVLPELKTGGAQRVVLGLLAELDPARHDTALLLLDPSQSQLAAAVPPQVQLLSPPPLLRRLGLPGLRLATLWHARRFDVVIGALEMRATFCAAFASRWLGKPGLAWVHIAFDEWSRGLSAKNLRRCRDIYSRLTHAVFVSPRAEAGMARWLGWRQPGWRTIPNLFSAEGYARSAQATPLAPAAAALLARMAGRPTVLGIGRLDDRKNFQALIEALALMRQRGVLADLVVLGEGPLREPLLAQAQALGVAEQVHLPGQVGNPLDWLRAATVYALSSRIEGLPTTIIEAMTVGTPVVATDCPSGPRELLQDGRIGPLVPMNDSPAMADALARLLQSPAERQRCREAGLQRARDFAPPAVLQAWDALIDELHPTR